MLIVHPTGRKSWKAVYSRGGRPRWYHIGTDAIGLAAARELAMGVAYKAAEGHDPVAERRAERSAGTFAELAAQYLDEHAGKINKSFRRRGRSGPTSCPGGPSSRRPT